MTLYAMWGIRVCVLAVAAYFLLSAWSCARAAEEIDLTHATVVGPAGESSKAAQTAQVVLIEEVEKRTGLRWPASTGTPESGPRIVLESGATKSNEGVQPEGYRIVTSNTGQASTCVMITAPTGRGLLYGVGRFLRLMDWAPGSVRIHQDLDITAKPLEAIRGHQLGYRHTANSYDAWDEKQYEQYIRELVIFGGNAVENIPFQDDASPVMPIPREAMNLKMSEICDRYDVDYWVWAPAVFDLEDTALRTQELDKLETFYRTCPRLDGVFFPGGDPGDNPPELVLPFLEESAKLLAKYHPKAGMWISLQGFEKEAVEYFYRYLEKRKPAWLAGVVNGPQSPPILETRRRLPAQYRLRLYPDITHTVLCQYPVTWWDPACALTIGREPVNPRPRFLTHIHNYFAAHSDGFLTYSDGIHDDFNKILYNLLAWDPNLSPRDAAIEYSRFFFGPDVAEQAADGLLAFETNWDGSLALNGAVDASFAWWEELAWRKPELSQNWRWRLYIFRAAYDYFTRQRLLYETGLEKQANNVLASTGQLTADAAMDAALAILKRADTDPCLPDLRKRIEMHGEALFRLIGYQTSVERYHARNYERGAVLDFLDRPLNNRWWLEDEFTRIRALPAEAEKAARLKLIAAWEDPGPGSFYDDVGNVAKCPHVMRGEDPKLDPEMSRAAVPGFGTWMDNGRSRWRLSWLSSMDWPAGMVYEGLDPAAKYVVRMTGKGEALLRVNGQRVEPSRYSKEIGEFKEFPVPQKALKDGKITLTWDKPDEAHLNWRQQSMLTEVWVLKQ